MFKLIDTMLRMLSGAAAVNSVRLGAEPLDAHVEAWWDFQYTEEGRRGYEAWARERADIAAEWAAMSDEEKSDLNDRYERAMWAGQLPVGEGRYYDHWIAEHSVGYVGD
jgi:hypothetical protein